MRKFIFAVSWMACVGATSAADLTIGSPTNWGSTAEHKAIFDKVTVDADLTLDGANVTLTNRDAIVIGENASEQVKIVITNDANWVHGSQKSVTIKGKGCYFDLSQNTQVELGWGTKPVSAFGTAEYTGAFGTFGYVGKMTFASGVTGGTPEGDKSVMDIMRLGPKSSASITWFDNQNAKVIPRFLFDGGAFHVLNNSQWYRFSTGTGCETRLEGINGNDIIIRKVHGEESQALTYGAGYVVTTGACNLVLFRSNMQPTKLNDHLLMRHTGDTYFDGDFRIKLVSSLAFPHGEGPSGILYLGRGANKSFDGVTLPGTQKDQGTQLDLNGHDITVNGIWGCASAKGWAASYSLLTNSSATVSTVNIYAKDTGEARDLADIVGVGERGHQVYVRPGTETNIVFRKFGPSDVKLASHWTMPVNVRIDDGVFTARGDWQFAGNLALGKGVVPDINGFTGANTKGFEPVSLAVEADDGSVTFTNMWQKTLAVRSGTAVITNSDVNTTGTQRGWRVTRSKIDAVSVGAGATLKLARGALSAENLTVAAGGLLHVCGGEGLTNRVEFHRPSVAAKYIRFVFKDCYEPQWGNRTVFGLNDLNLVLDDYTRTFKRVAKGSGNDNLPYTLRKGVTVADLNEKEYLFTSGSGIAFVTSASESAQPCYSDIGLLCDPQTTGWKGIRINNGTPPRLNDPSTWITLTIRLADDEKPLIGYTMIMDWTQQRAITWDVESSANGTDWVKVDSRTPADIYTWGTTSYSDAKYWPDRDGYNLMNRGEMFEFRGANADATFLCAGAVQLDQGALLDLSNVPKAGVSLAKIVVDRGKGAGRIVNFVGASNGTLELRGYGAFKGRRNLGLTLQGETASLQGWTVTSDGVELPEAILSVGADGQVSVRNPTGFAVIVR